MTKTSRRSFLKTAAAAALAFPAGLPALELASSPLRAWRTSPNERYREIAVDAWKTVSGPASAAVEIDAAEQFQSILGFGCAFTDASCYLLSRMAPAARGDLIQEFLGEKGLRLSVGRTCIGASDYSRNAYSFDDTTMPDPELKHFSIAHDREYILPMLREAQQANPELFLFSAPWSPPGWMKTGGSMLGGSMRKAYFEAYAQYFVKFLKGYQAEGVKIQAVTTQNEVDTDQDGRMPATLWGQEYEAGFIREFLGPALRKASLDTKIWLLDHNYNLWGRVLDELGDPAVSQYVDGIAWHGYVGTPDAMTRVHQAFPSKDSYWTEGGPDVTAPDYETDWTKWSGDFAVVLKNWARCIVAWNLVLDEKGQPNIGPFSCGGVVTLDSKTQKVARSGQYWALAHYSKTVRRGARVIATRSSLAGVEHVAFANPGGSHVLVLTNRGEERDIDCRFQGSSARVHLPGNSVATLQWS